MKRIKKVVWLLLNYTYIGGLLQLSLKSALKEAGWFKSFQRKEAIDNSGKPIAWCTYSFMHFIHPRLQNEFNVFEYGCGNSTIWYAKKVNSIKSVEHDKSWLNKIQSTMPANSTIVYKELIYGGDYSKEVGNSNQKYQIVIVDGRDRNNCLLNSISQLTDDGVVVFDNSNLRQYQTSISEVMQKGFKKIDFYGMTPIAPHESCTSIIYRQNNCLNI
jgi:hypothetical protein